MTASRLALIGLFLAIAGCTREAPPPQRSSGDDSAAVPAQPDRAVSFEYDSASAGEGTIALTEISAFPLGTTDGDAPTDVRSLVTHGDRIILLDGKMRRLRGYDRSGKLLFSVGKWGKSEGEMDTPVALRLLADTIVLLDVSHDDHVKLYSLTGDYLSARVFPIPEGPTSFEISSQRMVFATLSARTRRTLPYAMVGTDNSGRVRWLGCQVDPQYAASAKDQEMASQYAFRTLASLRDRLFCIQPLTPVIQIYDTSGNYIGAFRRSPSFYRPASRMAETQNTKDMQRFESQWTAHVGLFPFPDGVVSVYATWSLANDRLDYLLFRCDSGAGRVSATRCGITQSPGQPVALLGVDTLLVVSRDSQTQRTTLHRYLMRAKP